MSDRLPKIFSLEALALSPAESRAFPRWYTDLLLRKRTDNITIGDVLAFVDNFGVSVTDKRGITGMFGDTLVTLDPAQFYVFLRLTGHVLQGKHLRRELAFVSAPVPKPRSILSGKHARTSSRDRSGQDMDSFMSLMSGNNTKRGISKRTKRVTFDSKPPQVTEAAHRSMEELLRQGQIQNQLQLAQQPSQNQFQLHEQQHPHSQAQQAPEPEPEPDQPIINNQFARVNIDSVLHNGQSMLPEPPAPRKAGVKLGDSFIQQLTQNSQNSQNTEPPQFSPAPPPRRQSISTPQHSGLPPNLHLSQNPGQFLSPQVSGMTGGSPQSISPQNMSPQVSGSQNLGAQSTGSLPLSMHLNGTSRPPLPQGRLSMSQYTQYPSMQAGLQAGLQSGIQTGLQPGIQPGLQNSIGANRDHSPVYLSTQSSGLQQDYQPGYFQPVPTGMQATGSAALQPVLTGGYQPPVQLGMQSSGMQPQMSGFPQSSVQSSIKPSITPQGTNSGMNFLNSVQNTEDGNAFAIQPPPQYVRTDQPYDMRSLRDQMPNW